MAKDGWNFFLVTFLCIDQTHENVMLDSTQDQFKLSDSKVSSLGSR